MEKVIKKKILFVIIFVVLGLAVSQIPVSPIIGSKQSFTPFEFLGPTSGMFLGAWPAAVSVFFVKLFSSLIGHQSFEMTTIIRLFPMVLAAIYFGLPKSKKLILIVPLLCMLLFIVHPEGRKAWYFALYWLIPIICFFKKDRLILNALGSTFTAHAVGSTAFLYALNLPAPVWLGLIPIVFMERALFSAGIWATYLVLNTALEKLVIKRGFFVLQPLVNPKYVLSVNFFRFYA
jgi:hypothetical protein